MVGIKDDKIDLENGFIFITGNNIDIMKLVQELGKKNVQVLNVQKQAPQTAAAAPASIHAANQPRIESGQSSTTSIAAPIPQLIIEPGQSSTTSLAILVPQPRPVGDNGRSSGPTLMAAPAPTPTPTPTPAPVGSNGYQGPVQHGLLPPGQRAPTLVLPGSSGYQGPIQQHRPPPPGQGASYGGPRPEQPYGQGYGGYGQQNGPYGAPTPPRYGPQVGYSSGWQGQQVGPYENVWQESPNQYERGYTGYGNMQTNFYSPFSEENPNSCSVM